jgi:Xaa-Pro aminopeptidase
VPIDLNLVETSLLTEGERAWLNAYHLRVRETLQHLVDDEARVWLERVTRSI